MLRRTSVPLLIGPIIRGLSSSSALWELEVLCRSVIKIFIKFYFIFLFKSKTRSCDEFAQIGKLNAEETVLTVSL